MSKNSTDIKSNSNKSNRSLVATAFVCAFIFVFLGCDRQARHNILTFFFEGVPPLDGDPNGQSFTSVVTSGGTVYESIPVIPEIPKTPEELALLSESHSSKHKFLRDCAKCHAGSMSSGRRELRKSMPGLCYSCHKDFSNKGDFLHGPLNVGACIICHDPHQSKYVNLQKDPQPKLCYRCHTRQEIRSIVDHEKILELKCTNCHDPHVSSLPKLLKAITIDQGDPNETDPNSINENVPEK
jgi:predicted CXXCH cytochrome family protein